MSTSLNVAPIPLGRAGLNGSKNMAEMSMESLIVAENITYENGVIEKEGGAEIFTPSKYIAFSATEQTNPKQRDLYDIVWNGDIFCAVGEGVVTDAYIVTSPDGVTWTERANPKAVDLWSVAWSGSLFCAVGNADGTDAYIVTSPDGVTWTERSNPKNISLRSITWNGSLFCAVGQSDGTDAYIITSPDGITWTERSNPKDELLWDVIWDGSLFVAVGNADATDAYIITSPDGATWTERSNPDAIILYSVGYGNGIYCAMGSDDGESTYIVTSTDAITWTKRIAAWPYTALRIIHNGEIFIGVGGADGTDAYVITSKDGITWTQRSNPKNRGLYGIAWNGSFFCAVGLRDGTDAYIVNFGETHAWTERSNDYNVRLNDIIWDGNRFLAVGDVVDSASACMYVSNDGITWENRYNPKAFNLNGVSHNGSMYCAVGTADGSDAYIVTSFNNSEWTERSNPKNIQLRKIAWNGSVFCAVGDADGTDAYIITSPDGITWTERSNPKNITLYKVIWNGSIFVAVGAADGTDAYIVTSSDGSQWTERSNPKNFHLYGITWSGSLFVAVGAADGTDAYIITSPDGITWTERANPKNFWLQGASWSGSYFVAAGQADGADAYIVTSSDGINWNEEVNPKNFYLVSVAWNGEIFCAVGLNDGTDSYIITSENNQPSILGGHDWDHDGNTQRTVALFSNGAYWKDSGGGIFSAILANGLNVTDISTKFVECGKEVAANNRKLFLFTGKNAVQVLSADTSPATALATPPSDWSGTNQPYFGALHEGRVFAGGNDNDPHRIYYSTENDHEDFTGGGSGSISIYPGQGQRLVGAVSFKEFLVCFKYPTGIYAIDMTNPTFENWKIRKISEKIGAAWYGTIEEVLDDIVFIDQTGEIRTLTSIDTFADVGTDSLSDLHEISTFIRENLSFSRNSKWRMQYYSTKKELHIAVTTKNSAVNDARLVIDFNRSTPRFRYSTRDICVSLWTRLVNGRPELMAGDNNSTIYRLDQPVKSKDDAGYLSKFQTPHIDFGDPVNAKNGKFLELAIQPKGDHNLSVDIIWDGVKTDTKTFNMTTTASLVSGPAVINKRRKIVGSGTRFSMVCYNSGADQDFAILGANLHYSGGGEDTRGTSES